MVQVVLVLSCLAGPAWAQSPTGQKSENARRPERKHAFLTIEAIEQRLKQIENAANLEDSVKKSLIETYSSALAHLKAAKEHASKAAEFRKQTAEAPRELEELKAGLDAPAPEPPQINPEMGLFELQEALIQAEKDYEALQKRLAELRSEPTRRAERRIEIPELQEEARRQIEEIEKRSESNSAGSAGLDPTVAAERVLQAARRHALEHELKVYEEELRHYELTSDLIEARRDHALVQTEHAERHLRIWRSALNDRRRRDVEEQAQAAQKAIAEETAAHAPPAIRRLAEENAELVARREDLVARLDLATKELETLQSQYEALEELDRKVRGRVKRIGLTESIGILLRKQRDDIPNVAEHQRFIDERKAEISKLSLEVEDLRDRRETLADLDEAIRRVVSSRDGRRSKRLLSEAEVRKTLEMMRNCLDSLIADTGSYIDVLEKLDEQESELVVKARGFSDFTREYILWIKSAGLPQPGDAAQLTTAIGWIAAPREWSAALQEVASDARSHKVAYAAALVAAVVLVLSQRFWRSLLRSCGRDASRQSARSIRPTGLALVSTVVLAAIWPALLWAAGWRIKHLAGHSEFQIAVARALEGAAFFLATINLIRQLCRSLGLAEAHFGWPAAGLKLITGSASRLTLAGLPLATIVLMTESQSDEPIKNTLGRAAFVALQVLLLAIAHQVWHSPQGLARSLSPDADRWWVRLCRLGHLISITAPLGLAILAIVGYYYTAVQLGERVLVTAWLAAGVLVVHALLLRWLLLAYRDLAMRRGREQRAEEAAARSMPDHVPESAAAETTVQLSDINLQTHKLLGLAVCCAFIVGCSVIWAEILPAFEIVESVQLWPRPFTIVDPDSISSTRYALNLGELTIALCVALFTGAAARNVPGLMEIVVLRHLKLASGARYAVDALTQYTIWVCGLFLAAGRLGVTWANVQWLVAAMTVGLGFGLQEIFANLASGLLLLFERPIRIGDTVSIGDITGKVTRIRIRATTIVDGDMRELIVPNRELISGKVINWTLSDTISRMTIKIGVPHGSDPDLVKRLLLHVAASHPLVLKEPPPHALFDEFADDTLNFTLRAYMGSRDVYDQLRHDLNAGINAALHEAGIEKTAPVGGPPHELPHAA
jgi:potassium efflux system protein